MKMAEEEILREMHTDIGVMKATMERVEAQTVKTNGRVSSLERFKRGVLVFLGAGIFFITANQFGWVEAVVKFGGG